jgi:hypothetical protein
MTAKEKSKELYEKFLPHSSGNSNNNVAKKCALIAVDEVLLNERERHSVLDKTTDYWQEVKNELNQL